MDGVLSGVDPLWWPKWHLPTGDQRQGCAATPSPGHRLPIVLHLPYPPRLITRRRESSHRHRRCYRNLTLWLGAEPKPHMYMLFVDGAYMFEDDQSRFHHDTASNASPTRTHHRSIPARASEPPVSPPPYVSSLYAPVPQRSAWPHLQGLPNRPRLVILASQTAECDRSLIVYSSTGMIRLAGIVAGRTQAPQYWRVEHRFVTRLRTYRTP